MGRTLVRLVLAALLASATASSLADTRQVLCGQSPPSQLPHPQSHPQWLTIDWISLIKGNHWSSILGIKLEFFFILSSLAIAFGFLVWLQRRLKATARLTRQPLPAASVLLLFILLATAYKCTSLVT